MAFFKFTALTIAIDACDVAIIAPRTVGLDTDSTVMMARGQTVLPALTPAEAAAEVDATSDGDPLMAGPYDTLELGDGCYFGGRQVQRIAPTADGLGCVVTFGNVPAVLTVPDVDVDTMTSELNATGECGGGGGGSAFFASPTNYEPTITETAGLTTTAQIAYVRAGDGTEPSAGDWVYLYGYLEIDSALVGNGQISFPLPLNGEAGAGYSVTFYDSEATAFQIGTDFATVTINATFAAQTYYTNFSVSYQVEAS